MNTDKLKHIIIAHLYQPGTAATNRIFAYAKSFTELGKDVTLVLGCDNSNTSFELNEVGLKVKTVVERHGYRQLKAMADAIKKDYLDGHTTILVYGSPALCWFLPKDSYNIFYECTEVPMYGRVSGLQTRLKEGVKMFLAKRATGMLVISKALLGYFTKRGIENIAIINMFVDTERFKKENPANEGKYVAYCGTVSPFKDGVDNLIKSFAIFHKTHSDYRLKIIGKFENDESEKTVRGLADELGITESIDFTGMVTPDEIPQLLKGAAMLALARPNNRQAQFGFPTKLGEYLATGNPVVVTQVGEIGDFLHDGENCLMALPSDVEDFAEKMAWVADHQSEASAIGTKGKELTKNEFSALEQSRNALNFMAKIIDNCF